MGTTCSAWLHSKRRAERTQIQNLQLIKEDSWAWGGLVELASSVKTSHSPGTQILNDTDRCARSHLLTIINCKMISYAFRWPLVPTRKCVITSQFLLQISRIGPKWRLNQTNKQETHWKTWPDESLAITSPSQSQQSTLTLLEILCPRITRIDGEI